MHGITRTPSDLGGSLIEGVVTASDYSVTEGDTVTLTFDDQSISGAVTASDYSATEGDTVTLEFDAVTNEYQWLDDNDDEISGETTNETNWTASLTERPPRIRVTNPSSGKSKIFRVDQPIVVGPLPDDPIPSAAVFDFNPASANVFTDTIGTTPATNGSLIARVNDAGTNFVSQSTSGNRPTLVADVVNSLAIARYSSASRQLVSNDFTQNRPWTALVVFKLSSAVAGSADVLLDGKTILTGILACGQTNGTDVIKTFMNAGNALDYFWAIGHNEWAAVLIESNSTSSKMRWNGVDVASGNAGTGQLSGISIGGLGGGGRCANFDLARAAVFNGALSANPTLRSSIESYVSDTYGVTLFTGTKKVVVFDGDSITQGFSVESYENGPSQTFALLGGFPWVPHNYGRNGYRSDQVLADQASRSLTPYDAAAAENVYLLRIGTNDLLQSRSVASIEADITSLVSAAQSAGFSVVVATIPAIQDHATAPGGAEADRQTLNTWIRANTAGADAIADYASQPLIDAADAGLNSTYFQADKLHPNAAGYALMAAIDAAAITSL